MYRKQRVEKENKKLLKDYEKLLQENNTLKVENEKLLKVEEIAKLPKEVFEAIKKLCEYYEEPMNYENVQKYKSWASEVSKKAKIEYKSSLAQSLLEDKEASHFDIIKKIEDALPDSEDDSEHSAADGILSIVVK